MRPQTKRWLDADCPKGVLAIFDSKGPGERFTVFYADPVLDGRDGMGSKVYQAKSMSKDPFCSQGIGLSFEIYDWQLRKYRQRFARHKCKWSSLPSDCKQIVRDDLKQFQGAAQ